LDHQGRRELVVLVLRLEAASLDVRRRIAGIGQTLVDYAAEQRRIGEEL
jgi:hypothetical protein